MTNAKKKSKKTKTIPFDAARYLESEETIAEYMAATLETNDPELLIVALGDIARARGMAEIARRSGLGRESLYKALAPGSKPRLDTIMKVAEALGVRFAVQAIPPGA